MTNEELNKRYYIEPASEYIRNTFEFPMIIEDEDVARYAIDNKIDIHMFKKSPARLPRIIKTIGMIKQMNPSSLLEAGCGPGVFLWTLIDNFPELEIMAEDKNTDHYRRVSNISKSNRWKLSAGKVDLENRKTWQSDYKKKYDVSVCLEVLEHIPNWKIALEHVCESSKRFVIVSFPSKADNNPEHIHLIDKNEVFDEMKNKLNICNVKFDYVNGHVFVVGSRF